MAGSLQVAGLEILGVRAYDPVSRGFISPDPLVSPVGAGWASNVYAFVGNDPVGLVDPWGLSPLTAGEFREYASQNAGRGAGGWPAVMGMVSAIGATRFGAVSGLGERVQGLVDTAAGFLGRLGRGFSSAKDSAKKAAGGLFDGAKEFGGKLWGSVKDGASKAWDKTKELGQAAFEAAEQFVNDHSGLVAGLAIVGGIALMATGPLGWIGMAAVGGLLSFGGSVATQKLFGGQVSLKKALTEGALGMVGGGVGKLASMGVSAFSSSRAAGVLAQSGVFSKAGSVASSVRSSVGSAFSSARSAVAPAVSRVSSALGPVGSRLQPAAGVVGQWGRNVAGQYTSGGAVGEAVEGGVSGAVNNAGGYVFGAENGYEPSVSGVLRSAGVGFGVGVLTPGVGGAANSNPALSPVRRVVNDRAVDFVSGGTNYLLSPSNDNKGKDLEGVLQEGFKNSLAGGSSAVGQRSAASLDAEVRRMVPDYLEGVEVSRRDVLTGNVYGASADGQGIDQRRE